MKLFIILLALIGATFFALKVCFIIDWSWLIVAAPWVLPFLYFCRKMADHMSTPSDSQYNPQQHNFFKGKPMEENFWQELFTHNHNSN